MSDSGFIQQFDPRLAKPFLIGLSQAWAWYSLVGSAVRVIAFAGRSRHGRGWAARPP